MTDAALQAQFSADGFLVLRDVVPAADREDLIAKARYILEHREQHAADWDWRQGESLEKRQFRIVPCPLNAGDITFHHSKTPHQTGGNSTDRWRLSIGSPR